MEISVPHNKEEREWINRVEPDWGTCLATVRKLQVRIGKALN